MLNYFETSYIFLAALIIATIITMIAKSKFDKKDLPLLERSIKYLRVTMYIFIFLAMIIMFTVPSTAVLGSFGYPDDITDINSQDKILNLLQEYNTTIVETTGALHKLSILFMVFFAVIIGMTQNILKEISNQNK